MPDTLVPVHTETREMSNMHAHIQCAVYVENVMDGTSHDRHLSP